MPETLPLVTVITPTWHRHDKLIDRCIPSVREQTYPNVEHLIVSDGPDPDLAAKLFPPWRCGSKSQWYASLPEHPQGEHWGSYCRLYGLELAAGEFITYVDDDDSLRPNHCELLAKALIGSPEAGWAKSVMASHHPDEHGTITEIGWAEPCLGNVGTPMIMHRRKMEEYATWSEPHSFEDWNLVNAWIQAGVPWVRVDEITIDVWPSLYFGRTS